jgi:predicted ester cyclase
VAQPGVEAVERLSGQASEQMPGEVAVRLTFRGTHQGEFLGVPATGRSVEYVSHEFYRIAGGLVAEEWICSDLASLQGQLTAS